MSRSVLMCVWLLAAHVLTGCGSQESAQQPGDMMGSAAVSADAGAPMEMARMAEAPTAAAPAPATPEQTSSAPAAMIAYSYSMGLELPAERVIPVRDAHLKACVDAGPSQCQLLGASSNSAGEERVSAQLQLRGAPAWLATFRTGIESDATKFDGRLVSNSIGSEDLTRQIIDTEATLRAQITLRTRLTELLSKHQGKLADLLEVERELARVQGEIDARTSALNVMRTRIAMSDLSVSYDSRGVLVSDRTADPTMQALYEFLDTVSYSFASVIRFIAGILPWLVLLIPVLWLLRRWWRKR